jgi:hypothetical protein
LLLQRSEEVVWLLGAKNPYADESFPWESLLSNAPFRNLSEPDVLVINLVSLAEDVLTRIDKKKLETASDQILDRFLNKGRIIVITAPRFQIEDNGVYSNYYLSPIDVRTNDIGESFVKNKYNHKYSRYLDSVRSYRFFLEGFDDEKATNRLTDMNKDRINSLNQMYPDIPLNIFELHPIPDYSTYDNAMKILSAGFEIRSGYIYTNHYRSGEVIFLPPSSDPIDESITRILEVHGKNISKELPPDWTNDVNLDGMDGIKAQIVKLEESKWEIEQEIEKLNVEKEKLSKHLRLLYAKDTPLEDAVKEAFTLLGLQYKEYPRGKEKEDGIISFDETKEDYEFAVIETKGLEEHIKLRHIDQTCRWVSDYIQEDKKVKGVFIPNQFRQERYSESIGKRTTIEYNLEKHARDRDICIIPSSVLFEAVNKKLKGEYKRSRKNIEELIANTDGILTEL